MVKETKGNGDYQIYSWSVDDQLREVEFYDSGDILVQTVKYSYDYQGSRVSRSMTGGDKDGDYIGYLTDYQNLTGYSQTLAEVDKTETKVSRNFLYGNDLLGQRSGGESAADPYFLDPGNPANDELAFLHTDHLASSRLLTDPTGSTVNNSLFDFSPYGELLSDYSSLETSYQFTGQYYDSSLLGLQYHRAPWYELK